jgi:anaerobic selenocysteine-containing dehydrogenase
MAGNPMMAWPDQNRAFAALKSLDLLVTADPEMSATARLSHYVIAPKLTLELPGTSLLVEAAKYYGHNRGIEGAYGRYFPAAVAPPAGSDVIADWELYYGLARRMGLSLTMKTAFGIGKHLDAETQLDALDMLVKPTDEDIVALSCRNARVPLATVQRYPHGHVFDEVALTVAPRSADCSSRLDVGNSHMMQQLAEFRPRAAAESDDSGYLLLPRRTNRMMNSSGRLNPKLSTHEPTNPAYLHPDDMADLGIAASDRIEITTRFGSVIAVAQADPRLLRGCISITHGFGMNPDEEEIPEEVGCNVGRLLSADAEFDTVSGIPRMGGVRVAIRRVTTPPAH